MNEIYLHRKFIKKTHDSHITPFLQVCPNKPNNGSMFSAIADRIIKKQQKFQSPPLENTQCIQCNRIISSERNVSTGKWYYPDFNEKTKLCRACEHLNLIKRNPEKFLQAAGVPLKYLKSTFNNFEITSINKYNFEVCKKYTLQDKWNKGLFLYGTVGTGKTHLAVSILRELILKGKQGIFTSVPELLFKIRRAFQLNEPQTKTEEYYLKEYAECQFLILDDFGIEKTTEWNRQALDYIICERDNHLRPLILTTNLSLTEISQKIDIRIASRLAGMGQVLCFRGNDYRVTTPRPKGRGF